MKFEEFYQKYRDALYIFLYKRTGNKETAEDIAAETFFKLFKLWETLDKEEEKRLLAWMYTSARNLVIDNYRKESKNTGLNFDPALTENVYEEIANNLDMKEDLKQVYKAIAKLPEEKQEVLELRFKHGMKNKEIAEALGKSEGAVKMLVYRSLIEIRDLISLDNNK